MLKSNSKKAIENIKLYIMKNYDPSNYDINSDEQNAGTFKEVATCILKDLKRVKENEFLRFKNYTWQDAFIDWASGLPSILDTCYYYNREAVEDLGEILEESETEKARFTESEAENMLSKLLFRELVNAAGNVLYN